MSLTPKEIVTELDKYIIGQDEAKKAVAIALRNRYRRSQLPKEIRDEITPKNIIMKGPTGVGKTEIARRLAKLVKAPFVKIEATKYTEVGYVGRDVESMVRDLVSVSVRMVKDEKMHEVEQKAKKVVDEKLLKVIAETLVKNNPQENLTIAEIEDNYNQGKYENLTIDIGAYEVIYKGNIVRLAPKELELFHFMTSNPNKVFTREQLMFEVWGYDYPGDSRTVDVHVKRLREKIKAGKEWELQTVWGVGYKFEVR